MNETTARPTRHAPPPTDEAVYTEAPAANLPARTDGVAQAAPAKTVSERIEAPEADLPTSGSSEVITAIAAIMADLKPIEKSGWNDFQKYAHVRMQDLSRELTPLMGKHGIVVFQTEEGRELFDNGNAVAVRYRMTVAHKSGAIWVQRPLQTGVSMCRTSNGKFDDKALNKCHTSARKYFLLSLFQIASEDDPDIGDDGPPPQRQGGQQRPRRRAPSPTGKVSPHILPVVKGELPIDWAKRFVGLVAKAETKVEIDEWYGLNEPIIGKIQNHKDGEGAYNAIIDSMDAREAVLLAPGSAQEPAKTVEADKSGQFPGDAKTGAAGDPGPIPDALKRVRRAPAPKPDTSDAEREWLEGLEMAFAAEDDRDGLDAAFVRLLEPHITKFSAPAVDKANELYNTNCDRIHGGS